MEHNSQETLSQCPLCGSSEPRFWASIVDHSITKEVFSLVDCERCGFRSTNPRPDSRTIGRYYQSAKYISHSDASSTIVERLYQVARRIGMRGKYRIVHQLHPHGRILDIGCGTGSFLAYLMSRGYLVQGVEPDLKARERAIAEHGIPVLPSLEQVPGFEQFQVVTLWHVLEHLPDLRSSLKRIYAQLADQGVIIIAVPDRGAWDADHYKTAWAAWDVPRHFYHFRQKDVHALLREHGFELIQTRKMWLDAPYIAILSEGYMGSPKLFALLRGGLMGVCSNLISLLTNRPTSSSLYLARKAKT